MIDKNSYSGALIDLDSQEVSGVRARDFGLLTKQEVEMLRLKFLNTDQARLTVHMLDHTSYTFCYKNKKPIVKYLVFHMGRDGQFETFNARTIQLLKDRVKFADNKLVVNSDQNSGVELGQEKLF